MRKEIKSLLFNMDR